MVVKVTLFNFFILLLLANTSFCQELVLEPLSLQFEQPVDIVSTYVENDTRLFVVEKTGRIFIIDNPRAESPMKLEEPYLDLSSVVNDDDEGGLLGLAFSPEYDLKGYLFVNYTLNDPNNGNAFSSRISRFNVFEDNPNKVDPTSEIVVLTVEQEEKNHNGGDLVFGPDEMLYIPFGDGGGANDEYFNSQDPQSMLGKVLRIDVKTLPYNIPIGNPFKSDFDILDEIWSIGWRNPWRVSFDRETGDFWAGDVGQSQYEEINFEPANSGGAYNFGWNCYEGSIVFEPLACIYPIDHKTPVYEYTPSTGTKSVTGGYVYRGERHPDLIGKYVFTDYVKSSVFWIISKNGNEFDTERIELTQNPLPSKVSTFGEASDGELYFATLEEGKVWKLMTNVVINTENEHSQFVEIYPNPVKQRLYIKSNSIKYNNVKIYDINGKCVRNEISNDLDFLDVSTINPGMYIISIQFETHSIHKKILIE